MEALRIVRNDGEPGTVVRRTAVAGAGAQLVVAFADGSRLVVPESALEPRADGSLPVVIGLFDHKAEAMRAHDALLGRGFRSADLDILTRDDEDDTPKVGALRKSVREPDVNVYLEGVHQGGTLITVNTSEDKITRAAEIMDGYDVVNIDTRLEDLRRAKSNLRLTAPSADEQMFEVAEEVMDVGKKQVERGRMRVYTTVTEREVAQQVGLRDETITVQRRPVSRSVSSDRDLFKELVRDDIHPDLVRLLLGAAEKVHRRGGLLEREGAFPADTLADLPVREDASRYLKSGLPWLERMAPFWVAGLLDRLLFIVVPAVTILLPVCGYLIPLLDHRHRRRIAGWYARLRRSDLGPDAFQIVDDVEREIDRLDALQRDVMAAKLPPLYMGEMYNLTMHIGLVRERLEMQWRSRGRRIERA